MESEENIQRLKAVANRLERYFHKHNLRWDTTCGEGEVCVAYNHAESPSYILQYSENMDKFEKHSMPKKSIDSLMKDPGISKSPEYFVKMFTKRVIDIELTHMINNIEVILSRNGCILDGSGLGIFVRFRKNEKVNNLLKMNIKHRIEE